MPYTKHPAFFPHPVPFRAMGFKQTKFLSTMSIFDSHIDAHEALKRLPFTDSAIDESVPLRGTEVDDTLSPIYRNKLSPNEIYSCIHPDLNTHYKLFQNAAKHYSDQPCFGYRRYNYGSGNSSNVYESLTYKQVNERKTNLGAGILSVLQNSPYKTESASHRKIDNHYRDYQKYGQTLDGIKQEDNCSFIVSIYAPNRYEWILTDLACSAFSLTNTALYDTLGLEVTSYILESTESPVVVCSADQVKHLLTLKKLSGLASLISIVSMDPLDEYFGAELPGLRTRAEKLKVSIHSINEVEKIGSSSGLKELPPTPKTVYTVSFTSGTTGSKPKGGVLTQGNAAAAVAFLASRISQVKDGKAFIFLPLTHIYERETSAFAFTSGYYLGFPQLTVNKKVPARDSFELLLEDLRIFKPTYMSLVPRVLTRMESLIKSAVLTSPNSRKITEIINHKLDQQSQHDGADGRNHEMDDYGPYRALRSLLGFDNLSWTMTASAPISPTTISYLKASLNIGLYQSYGLTETFGAIVSSPAYEGKPGSCGPTGITGEFRIKSVPSMGYSVKEGKGELMVRGSQVYCGYYRNEEETNKALDKDGWFSTGDVARIDSQTGRVYIIDRVKNFFKMAQGEYVSPEKVENVYLSANPLLVQLFVHGNSLQSYLVGIVGIHYELGKQFLREKCGYNVQGKEDLLQKINETENRIKFLSLINANVGDKVARYEKLHNLHIEFEPLTVQRNVVTPTFKIKRAVASAFFANHIKRMYETEKSLIQTTKPNL